MDSLLVFIVAIVCIMLFIRIWSSDELHVVIGAKNVEVHASCGVVLMVTISLACIFGSRFLGSRDLLWRASVLGSRFCAACPWTFCRTLWLVDLDLHTFTRQLVIDLEEGRWHRSSWHCTVVRLLDVSLLV